MIKVLYQQRQGEWKQVKFDGQSEQRLRRMLAENDNSSEPVRVEVIEPADFSCPCFGAPEDDET